MTESTESRDLPEVTDTEALGRELGTLLRAGDLVFFNTTGRTASHVGIYLGNGMMANANSYQGRTVVEPMFSNPYWASRYMGARRVLS